jgi:dipeptidyl aminopeptidase/acylaminoacyl peptidase
MLSISTFSCTAALIASVVLPNTRALAAQVSGFDRSAAKPGPDPAGALPYELAFDARTFPWSMALSVSADGRYVAYSILASSGDVNRSERFQPNGTPSSLVGAKVQLTDRQTGRSSTVCPGGNCWGPSLSPNATQLAFYSDRDGPPQLWLHDIVRGSTRKLSPARIKAKLWSGDEAEWSSDGTKIFVPTAPDSGPGAWLPTPKAAPDAATSKALGVRVLRAGSEAVKPSGPTRAPPRQDFFYRENNAALSIVDVRSGEVRVIVPAEASPRPSVLRLSGSGRWLSYLSTFKDHGITSQVSTFDLAVVPVAGGTPILVAADLPVLGDYHKRNYAWHPSEDRLVYFKDGGLWLVDVGSSGVSPPRRLGESLGALAPTQHWFTRDGASLIAGADPIDDKGYADVRLRALAVIPLDGSPARRIAIDSAFVFDDLIKTGSRTVWQPEPGSVTALLTQLATGERTVVRFDLTSGRSQVLWKGRARLTNLTGDASHTAAFGTYQDIGTAPDVYRFPASFATRERVSHIDSRLDGVAAATVELFETTIPGYNGKLTTVRTAVLLPPGAKRGDRLPAIVLMYPGGDRTRETEVFGGGAGLTVPNLLLTSRGYALVLANLPLGPNKEAGNPLQEMTDELLPQVYRAAELGYIDINRLAIGGQSFGGYGTGAIISATNLFRGAVAVSGIYDLGGTYGYMDESGGSFWVGWSEGGQARMGSHPWANVMRYLENSPYYRADRIFTPVLLIHGDEDNAYHDAQKLFSALRRLDRPVQLATYEGMGHVVYEWTRPNAIDAAQRIVEFLRTHLGDPKRPGVLP